MLRAQFKMEMLVYSQDRTYSTSLSDRKREEEEEEEEYNRSRKKSHSVMIIRDNQATLQELMLHLKSYYAVSFSLERLLLPLPLLVFLGIVTANHHPPSFSVLCILHLTISMNLPFALPLCLLPGSSLLSILPPIHSLSLLKTCPNHLNPAFLTFSPKHLTFVVLSDVLVPNPVHPRPSQREAQHLQHVQLSLLSFNQYQNLIVSFSGAYLVPDPDHLNWFLSMWRSSSSILSLSSLTLSLRLSPATLRRKLISAACIHNLILSLPRAQDHR